MRVQTQEKARENRGGRNPQPATCAGVPARPERTDCRTGTVEPHSAAGESCQTPTLVLPAYAGLALPRLQGVATHYSIDNEQKTAAQVALSFLNAGIVQEGDEPHASPNTLIKHAIARTLGQSVTFPGMDLEFRIVKLEEQDSYYLLVFVEGTSVIHFDGAAEVFDRVDPQLGPSILGFVYRYLDLTPAFTPEVAKDLIRWQYWQGMDDDCVLLEEAEQELTHQFGGREAAFTRDDVVSYAQQHYLTSHKVDERLEPRYQEHGTLSLGECQQLCLKHKLDKALPILGALEKLARLQTELPDSEREINDLIEGETPFGLIITLGGAYDLVREVYGEYEQMIWQGGMDLQPTYALTFNPNEPDTLDTLKDTLATCRLVLEQTSVLCHALEDFA